MKTPAEIHAEVGCEITLDDCLSLAKSGAKAFYQDDIENIIKEAKIWIKKSNTVQYVVQVESERDQLRKVCDEYAQQLDRIGFYCAGNELSKDQSENIAASVQLTLEKHNFLPHVIEMNTK